MEKYCSDCGTEIKDGAGICTGCGKVLGSDVKEVKSTDFDNYAKSGFTFGLLSIIAWLLPIVGYPITIVAIYKSSKGLKSNAFNGKAVAGLVLGIIFLIATLCNSIAGVIMRLNQI